MTAHHPPDDARVHDEDDERLPCGRPLSGVWDAWERQSDDPHLRDCPHCRDAVRDLDRLESAVRDLREEPQDGDGFDASAVTRRVMDVVRLELRPGRPLPLGEPVEDLWIMESVAARVLRAAAETVPGVRAGSCRLRPAPDGGAASGAVEVRLDLHAPSDAPLMDLADAVRARVREAADREVGMDVTNVDIRVTDLVDTPSDGQEGRTR